MPFMIAKQPVMLTRVKICFILFEFMLAGGLAYAQPVASFNIIVPTSNCNPAVYSFVNASTGTELSYQWNFGVYPGINSIFENPSTTYLNCGAYVVKLIVTDINGLQDSTEQPINIRCSPNAQFITSAAEGCLPVSVQYTSTAMPGSGSITDYVWDFGDGSSGTGFNPPHTYNEIGCKNVTLIVTNTYGCVSDTTINKVLCVYSPPVGNFTSNTQTACNAPFTVTYYAGASGGTAPYSYEWLFPGGAPAVSSADSPSVTYNATGNYSAMLVVTDAHGCVDTVVKSNYISIPSNTVNFNLPSGVYCSPTTIGLTGIPSSNAIFWFWSSTPQAAFSHNMAQSTTVTLPDSGNYSICVAVAYTGGCTVQQCKTVTVLKSPVARFNVNGTLNTCVLPDAIAFIDSSSGNSLTYNWSFPGGTPTASSAQFPSPVNYSTCGNYSASLTVTDGAGCKNSVTKSNFLHLVCNTATYTVSPQNGCLPLTAYFNSTGSTGNPIAWFWDFNDPLSGADDTSTMQNPVHTYYNAGCYTITLTTINAQGCVSVSHIESAVCCGFKPHANFSANPPLNCANKPFAFTDSSTNTYSYTSYVWDFHHAPPYINESTAENPIYTYYDVGTYDITLIVSNYGCADTITKDDFVKTVVPVASPRVIKKCGDPLSVTLDGTASEGAQKYKWIILGGTPDSATTPTVSVTYPGPGDYNVSLYVVNDSTGCDDLEPLVVHIAGTGAQFTGSPLHGCAPLQSCFSVNTGGITSYNWQITDEAGVLDTIATSASPCFRFSNAGLYNVQLIVSDTLGCIDTIYKPEYISISQLAVNFSGEPLKGCAPLLVNFADSSYDANAGISKWSWHFGDNSSGASDSSHLQNPTHIYHSAGIYSVNLIVTDSNGCKSNTLKPNYIQVDKPVVSFTDISVSSCHGVQTCFTTSPVNLALNYLWSFGDGDISAVANACHLYTTTGVFNISLIATDSIGCTDTIKTINNISAVVSVPNFVADNTSSTCPPLLVSFTNLTTGVDSTTKWHWQFGDGQVSTLQNPTHIYTVAGIFSVTLIVTNSSGCIDTLTYVDYIKISGPSAYVSLPPTSGCVPHYTCMSVVSNSTNSYTWNFGDGTVQPGTDSVCYTYIRTGTFYPELILDDGIGCVFSLPIGEVDVTGTVAHFLTDTTPFCSQTSIQFTDSSYGTSAVQTWRWNFGDGASGAQNFSNEQNPAHFFALAGNYPIRENIVSTNGCVDSAIRIITIHAPPVVSVTLGDLIACTRDSVRFASIVTSPVPINSVEWNFGDTLSGEANVSDVQNPKHFYQLAGIYQITFSATDTNGCAAQDSIIITEHQSPTAAFTAMDTCIKTQPVFLDNTSQNATNYSWGFGDGASSSQFSPNHIYADTGVYLVSLITSTNYCSDTFAAPVQISGVPVAAFGLSANAICGPDADFIIINNSANARNYFWSFGDGTSSTQYNPVASYHSSGLYNIVLIANNRGCADTASKQVTLYPKPDIQGINIEPAEGCQPMRVTFSAQSIGADIYNWNFGTNNGVASSSVPTATHTFPDTGAYTITLTVSSIHNCLDTLVLPDTIKVHIQPTADFDTIDNSYVYPYNGTVSFVNRSKNADSYLWQFGDGNTITDINPSYEYARIDSYSILLIASTHYGCVDSIAKWLYVIKKALYAPNALQPGFNGSETLVKVWKPVGIGLLSYRAQIFDKWGELMWQSDSLSETQPVEAWDGTYMGKPCQEDVYVWKINAVFLDRTVWEGMDYTPDEGGGRKTIGSVTLIR